MARTTSKLTDARVRAARKPGRLSDGGNLYLSVSPSGSKSWVFMGTVAGKRREMGLGAYPAVGLARARELALDCRRLVAAGRDPIAERDRAAVRTFGEVAEAFVDANAPGWCNQKHVAQWRTTLSIARDETGAFADGGHCMALRSRPIDQIDVDDVLVVLEAMWSQLPETASRVRGRIERVLDFAALRGWRSGANPARWRGHLAHALPPRRKLTRGHHAAVPFREVPALYAMLAAADATAAAALRFLLLTAARTSEVRLATFDEIEGDVWTIPAARMKAGRAHRVPLTAPALQIIAEAATVRRSQFVFPGAKPDAPLSQMALSMALRRTGSAATVHGFRSAFRDWAGEATEHAREVAEAALAHVVGDATERAYRRGDALERRRQLMDDWAAFVASAPSVSDRI
nr:site-specific integrase [Prosthecomicrobium pneumaticum]